MSRAERDLARAHGSPDRAEKHAHEAHQRGMRAGNAGRPAVACRYLRAGLLHLDWDEQQPDAPAGPGTHRALTARLLISLAHWEAEQGRTDYGLRLLDRADDLTAAGDRGILLSQRGLLLTRTWRWRDALGLLDDAVPLLHRPADRTTLAAVLLNRAFLYLNAGDVRRARADLGWGKGLAEKEGTDLIAAKATHNLGYCDLLVGDIPAALQLFTVAAGIYRLTAPGNLPVLAMDKARALLMAGLADEAASELDSAIGAFRRQRLDQDLAEAELARSQAALAAGEPAAARRWAAAAERRFRRRGNDACAALAALTRLRARSAAPARPAVIAADAAVLAERLRGCGLSADAYAAELIGARALIMAGRSGEASRRIGLAGRRGPRMSLDVSLLRQLAQAELAEQAGQPGTALAELRRGLAMVQARRGSLGSLELQAGTGALGADLAAAGLRLALERGSASLVFAWLERSRAQAFRVRPVRPPADPHAAAVLGELRQLNYLIRCAELNGSRDQVALARRAELQREIRERSWQASGPGEARTQASVAEVSGALDESGYSLLSVLARDGSMYAVVIRRGSARLVRLGDLAAAAEASRRLNADLDTLAGRRLPIRLEAVIRKSIERQARILTDEIIVPLRSRLGDDGVVIVPAGALASIPWSVLPDLRGRPVTVCPSASSWLTAWRRGRTVPTSPGGAAGAAAGAGAGAPLLVAGPDLPNSAREVSEIAKIYPGSRRLLRESATVGATLQALDGAPLAHLAVHGHHDRENVLFSRLELADGPMMAYDVQQLTTAPRLAILSACDVGRTVVRPGEEILGFTAALLYMGTLTVISSVTRVADDDAMAIMVRCHRALRAGARPAEALAAATLAEPLSPFVCFGSG